MVAPLGDVTPAPAGLVHQGLDARLTPGPDQLPAEPRHLDCEPFPNERRLGSNEYPVGPDYALGVAGRYFNMRKASIYGGSNEIQRNIIAKAVLGL